MAVPPRAEQVVVLVAARNEAERIAATLDGLGRCFPGAAVWVADDASSDATAELARGAGAHVLSCHPRAGKGAAMTRAAEQALAGAGGESGEGRGGGVVVLCDGDLGQSAELLGPLAAAVSRGEAGIAVAAFSRRQGGGLGLAVGFARWAIRARCGLRCRAPISGQRALSARALRDVLPFAQGFGMELAMTIDAVRAGHSVLELELDLSHRENGRTPAGFLHRARQLADFVRAYLARGGARA